MGSPDPSPLPVEAIHAEALSLARSGEHRQALDRFDQALVQRPGSLELQLDRANALQALARHQEALAALDRILQADPDHLAALNNRGNLLQDLGRHDDALNDYARAIALDPCHPLLHNNRGMALRVLGRDLEARASYERAMALDRQDPRPRYNLANLLFGQPASHAFQLSPAGSLLEAIPLYREALRLDPSHPDAGGNLATVLLELGRIEEALTVLRASLQQQLAQRHQAGVAAASRPLPALWSSLLMFSQYLPGADPAALAQEARRWGEAAHGRARALLGHEPLRPAPDARGDRPLRIGYVSGDLSLHPVGLFLRCVLIAHDPARVTPFLYDNGSPEHDLNGRLGQGARRKGGEHRRVEALDDLALARLIREDRIDILVDISGHTARSRLELFALRPAALQLSWLGYFASTGLAAIDGLILDPVCAPEPGQAAGDGEDSPMPCPPEPRSRRKRSHSRRLHSEPPASPSSQTQSVLSPESAGHGSRSQSSPSQHSDQQFVEPVLRLPHSRFCFQPAPFAPEVAPAPFERNGFISFGSFNNTSKLNGEVLASWARILQGVPRSRLILQWRTFADPAVAEDLRQTMAELGVAPERLELRPSIAAYGDFLHAYADLDLALDPFPFSGGQTSCEALWQGVPVLTLPGSTVVSRQTLSFLRSIGLEDELAATDPADYEARAIALARTPTRLAELRRGLRDRLAASPLCDVKGFTTDLEHLFRQAWERLLETACRGRQTLLDGLDREPPEAVDPLLTPVLEQLRQHPDDPALLRDGGELLRRHGQLERALLCLKQAVELAPQDPLAHYNHGTALHQQGAITQAIGAYRRAIRLDGSLPAFWVNLGTALVEAGQERGAIEAFQQALRLDPELTAARSNLARVLLQTASDRTN